MIIRYFFSQKIHQFGHGHSVVYSPKNNHSHIHVYFSQSMKIFRCLLAAPLSPHSPSTNLTSDVCDNRPKHHSQLKKKNKGDKLISENDPEWIRQPDSEVKSLRGSLDRTKKVMEVVKQGTFPTKK